MTTRARRDAEAVRRTAVALALALTALAVAMVAVERGRAITDMGEVIPADEGAYTAEIIASAIESVNYPPRRIGRPRIRHTGATCTRRRTAACRRSWTWSKDLAPAFGRGSSREPGKQYRAWIRFSSGNTWPQHDSTRDARGFALKLMGVAGPKLLEPEATRRHAGLRADQQPRVLHPQRRTNTRSSRASSPTAAGSASSSISTRGIR